ncbi:hypothetical protein NP493_17g02040 [Ridgeia piscesae]|uniref:Uncharacterized protein n=1 Tax=Ridgeia piscesae TaxID=27915 RepID=A0AAD9UKX7_RIDPI|nr:hypothetical protein NP493_17g02040 [Ridgeia piscesae]
MTAVSDGHYTTDVPTARHCADSMPSVSQPLRSVCAVKSTPSDKASPGRFVLNAGSPSIARAHRPDSHAQTNGDVVIDTQHFYITHHHHEDDVDAGEKAEEAYFAGSRDVHGKDKPTRIVSDRGSVRGVKNRVRAGIETFQEREGSQPKVCPYDVCHF